MMTLARAGLSADDVTEAGGVQAALDALRAAAAGAVDAAADALDDGEKTESNSAFSLPPPAPGGAAEGAVEADTAVGQPAPRPSTALLRRLVALLGP